MTSRNGGGGRPLKISPVFTGILLAAFLAGGVRAGGIEADPDAGRRIADRLCSGCHAVGATGDSPLAAAPPFRTLGRRWPVDNLAEALAEGIVTGHEQMPPFELSPREIEDFIAWLEAVQTR